VFGTPLSKHIIECSQPDVQTALGRRVFAERCLTCKFAKIVRREDTLRRAGDIFIETMMQWNGVNGERITLAIPTYNRADIWRRELMAWSLRRQTDKNFELLICDDNSTDDTQAVLKELLPTIGVDYRILKCNAPKLNATQVSPLPQNILIRECRTSAIVFCDDDGWLDKEFIRFWRSLGIGAQREVYYGPIWFRDTETRKVIQTDSRLKQYSARKALVHRIPPEKQQCWGAVFAAPVPLLRDIGGHNMEKREKRAADFRLGVRLQRVASCWFVSALQARFHHLGLSFVKQHAGEKELLDRVCSSEQRDGTIEPTTCNGGAEFWRESWEHLYCEVEA
jgi:hypothetical protein